MGWWNTIFGGKKKSPRRLEQSLAANGSLDDGFFTSMNPPFMGRGFPSPDGRYVVGWAVTGNSQSAGEAPNLVLWARETDELVQQRTLIRPGRATVSNTGLIAAEDWLSDQELSGRFVVLSKTGDLVIDHRLGANIFVSGISPNGRYAFCQTAGHVKKYVDGGTVFFFDLDTGSLLFRKELHKQWPKSYRIDEKKGQLIAKYEDGSQVRIAPDEVDQVGRDADDLWAVCTQAEELLEQKSQDLLRLSEVEEAINRLRAATLLHPRVDAQSNRVLGQVLEALGRQADALIAWDAALAIDPKIGVKRKAEALRKRLGLPPAGAGGTVPAPETHSETPSD
ncbi:hypothetical protein HNP46_006117 [Pseudomonas nitritireducens]|uniref:Tetratricopeptide repeat protein n=1 Tax=Pseudomonas nitroreducens TaxID=46680 RepID=A0A7W7KQV7_PSENT|nr:tetratricopeptide repeat protein [Pseudomonas nitritireducens]MBB4867206.1 hypothetical protein [Pseudomonas nitritireducens]